MIHDTGPREGRAAAHRARVEDGVLPTWGRDCGLCLDCVASCPERATTCPLDWPVFRLFQWLNVRQALKDPKLEAFRVEWRRGKITHV